MKKWILYISIIGIILGGLIIGFITVFAFLFLVDLGLMCYKEPIYTDTYIEFLHGISIIPGIITCGMFTHHNSVKLLKKYL